jgi:hypothetical protein
MNGRGRAAAVDQSSYEETYRSLSASPDNAGEMQVAVSEVCDLSGKFACLAENSRKKQVGGQWIVSSEAMSNERQKRIFIFQRAVLHAYAWGVKRET